MLSLPSVKANAIQIVALVSHLSQEITVIGTSITLTGDNCTIHLNIFTDTAIQALLIVTHSCGITTASVLGICTLISREC